jgi:hypothetical protein
VADGEVAAHRPDDGSSRRRATTEHLAASLHAIGHPCNPLPNIAFGQAKLEGPFALSKVQVLAAKGSPKKISAQDGAGGITVLLGPISDDEA